MSCSFDCLLCEGVMEADAEDVNNRTFEEQGSSVKHTVPNQAIFQGNPWRTGYNFVCFIPEIESWFPGTILVSRLFTHKEKKRLYQRRRRRKHC